MKMERCEKCGVKLKDTTRGRKYCPNHGIVNDEEIDENEDKERSYLG